MGYSKGPEQLQSAATRTSAGREPGTIHIAARCATYYATGEDDMNGYCKLNMNCSPLLPSCEKVIWVLSKCIRAGFGALSTSKYRGVLTSVHDTCHQMLLLSEIRSRLSMLGLQISTF